MQCALVLVKTINLKITDTAYCVRKLYIIIESGGYIYIGIPSMILDISIKAKNQIIGIETGVYL